MSAGEKVLPASNQAYRYGLGLFETIFWHQDQMPLFAGHMDRLFSGLSAFQYKIPALLTREKIKEDTDALCRKITGGAPARVRLSFSPGEGGLFDGSQQTTYIIEAWPLDAAMQSLNTNGLHIGVYPDMRKPADRFSMLKHSSMLIYGAAANYARSQKWNDAIVLNTLDAVADTTIANLFLIRGDVIQTPGPDQAAVAGVMQKALIPRLRKAGYTVEEKSIRQEDLETADEIFLTNAIRGLRWVGRLQDKQYTGSRTAVIYQEIVQTILV